MRARWLVGFEQRIGRRTAEGWGKWRTVRELLVKGGEAIYGLRGAL